MKWQRLVGWQLMMFGAVWFAAVAWFHEPSATVLAAVPGVASAVLVDPDLARAVRYAPYGPALLAAALGLMFVWSARRSHPSLAQQFADESADRRVRYRG